MAAKVLAREVDQVLARDVDQVRLFHLFLNAIPSRISNPRKIVIRRQEAFLPFATALVFQLVQQLRNSHRKFLVSKLSSR